jgi:hypothetical protein
MKKLFLLLFFFSFPSMAIELKFIGPCDENFIMRTEVSDEFTNVGELTTLTLKKFGIPFIGSEEGLSSVFSTPVGKDAIEVISNDELRAYGWCYSVDGVAPEVFPHEVRITAETKSIVWHFGFALFHKGEWVTQCTPAYSIKPDFLCKGTPPEQ